MDQINLKNQPMPELINIANTQELLTVIKDLEDKKLYSINQANKPLPYGVRVTWLGEQWKRLYGIYFKD